MMSEIDQIGAYVRNLCIPADSVLDNFEQDVAGAGMPAIQVPAELGKLLGMLVRLTGARRVLEIGTLGGYSAAWMARSLPLDGKVITLEKSTKHAAFARSFLERAGVAEKVEIIVGAALETLPSLLEREDPAFDMAFIDADKAAYPAYLDWSLRLVRSGGVILGDNVLRGGKVLDPGGDADLNGLAEFNRHAASSPLLDTLILPNRGGQDGILVAVVK
ncbi:MAG: O-methyltransferase [Chloroflexota bacterium]|nr:O-methyltransferase [Chloroflexota bacterium]